MTDLVINVLTEENATKLKEHIFGKSVDIVRGSYSGTFGIRLSFKEWLFSNTSRAYKFLYSGETEKLIGMKPEDLCYYEFFWDGTEYEEIDFIELFPVGGFYMFDKEKVITLEYSNGKIFYRELYCYCRTTDAESVLNLLNVDKNPLVKSGLSKIYRRGFLTDRSKIEWKRILEDFLTY